MSRRASLGHMSIPTRVVLMGLVITGLFVATAFLWVLPKVENALLDRKREKTKEETEIAWGILDYYYSLARNGALTEDAAKSAARAMVSRLRYGPTMKDYFWINDMQGTMIAHPYRPDLVGQDLSDLRDGTGKYFIREFTTVCQQHGEGFVEYLWQRQDEAEKVVPKMSFVRLFRPWNWIVGTGMYVEDVQAEIHSWKVGIVVVFLILGLVGGILSSLIGQSVAKSVEQTLRRGKSAFALLEEDLGLHREVPWRLRSLVLVVTIPALVLLTGVWCVDLYHSLHKIIMGGFDAKLYDLSTVTASFIRGEDHVEIARRMTEQDDLYRRYTRPMRAILDKADVTYLYSQTLLDEGTSCRYILDASDGKDHSPIGSRDELSPADYRGAQDVQVHGTVYISEVVPTENWGILKTAYAPIQTADGSIVGMAGADANIAAIQKETRAALFTVSLIGVGAILLSVWFSFIISRRLTEPLEVLKAGALRLASGSYDQHISIAQPAELRELGVQFNKLGRTLERTFRELAEAHTDLEAKARRHELMLAIDRSLTGGLSIVGSTYAMSFFNNRAERRTASGWEIQDGAAILWVARSFEDPLEAVRCRSDIGLVLGRILGRCQNRPAEFVSQVERMYLEEVSAVFLHVPREKKLYSLSRERVLATFLRGQLPPAGRELTGASTVDLTAGVTVIVSDHPRPGSRQFREQLTGMGIGPGTPLSDVLAAVGGQSGFADCDRQVMAAVFGSAG